MWLNNWDPSTKTWSFVDQGIVSGGAGCTQGYGVIENDLGVRFADLTGDGKADYLCIERNGRVTGSLNRGMASSGQVTFEDVGQIKFATNYDRQNVRFNDVNGKPSINYSRRSTDNFRQGMVGQISSGSTSTQAIHSFSTMEARFRPPAAIFSGILGLLATKDGTAVQICISVLWEASTVPISSRSFLEPT